MDKQAYTHMQGNNAEAINVLGDNSQGWISFKLVLQCAENSGLHSKLRSKFVELMIGDQKLLWLLYLRSLKHIIDR